MRDKLHIEEVKVRLITGDRMSLEHVSRIRGIPPAVLARTFIKQGLAQLLASIQTGDNKGSPAQGLGATEHGNQSAA